MPVKFMPITFRVILLTMSTAAILSTGCKQAPPPETAQPAAAAVPTQIGGQDIVKLQRKGSGDPNKFEFLTATVFPGRGMNLWQVTANVPGKGETNVFFSLPLADAANLLNGGPEDMNGNKSFSAGGAFLVPYPNRIRGKLSADGKTITTDWHGKTLTLPANWKGKNPGAEPHAMHGLILASKSDDVKVQDTADGQSVTSTIHAGNFGGYWLSETDLTFNIVLTGDKVETTITAKNVGKEPEPMSIGWHPYFAIPSGDRKQAMLHVPGDVTAQVNNYDDVFPTGKLVPVKGTKYDFTPAAGKALGSDFLDDNFAKLKRTNGKVHVTLTDPAAKYGIAIDGISPEIKTVQVYAPTEPTRQFAAIEEQFNFGDPFGNKWHGMDTGMLTLKPGQSVTWKVELSLFDPTKPAK
jgi:aldose 1-epimerase